MKTGQVILVGAGPGDPELMTLGGRKAIEEADVVVYDRLVGREILSWIPETAERIELLFRDACMLKNNVQAVSAATADVAQRLSRRLSLRQLMDLCALTARYAGYVKRNANMALLVTAFCAKMRETAGR